jgi:hypothetical protein
MGCSAFVPYASRRTRQQIDAAILTSVEQDLKDGRFVGGRHSLDKMLSAIGAASGPMLVRLLQDPKAPYKGLAELLLKVGDESARDRGGAALVRRAAAESEIPNDLWIAIGTLGGQNATDFLTQKLLKGPPAEAALAAKALQQARYPSVLPLALKIAADPKANNLVRDEAFGVVEKIGGPAAQKGLVEIIANDKKDLVRYRAYEAALEAGKVEAVLPALQAFSDKLSFKKEDVADFLVKDITKLGLPAKPAVLGALSSLSALARITAIWALEAPLANPRQSLGTASDAAALLKLADDKASPKGFPAGVTVGGGQARGGGVAEKGRLAARRGRKQSWRTIPPERPCGTFTAATCFGRASSACPRRPGPGRRRAGERGHAGACRAAGFLPSDFVMSPSSGVSQPGLPRPDARSESGQASSDGRRRQWRVPHRPAPDRAPAGCLRRAARP